MTRWLLVLVFALLATPAAAQLRMSVRPGVFAFAPADVEVRLRVEPGGQQREVLLEVDGPEYFRSSLFPIRTDTTSPTVQPPAWYRSIPGGAYLITATLTDCAPAGCDRREQLARVTARLEVRGRDELVEDEP
jgi:hypothetical protein